MRLITYLTLIIFSSAGGLLVKKGPINGIESGSLVASYPENDGDLLFPFGLAEQKELFKSAGESIENLRDVEGNLGDGLEGGAKAIECDRCGQSNECGDGCCCRFETTTTTLIFTFTSTSTAFATSFLWSTTTVSSVITFIDSVPGQTFVFTVSTTSTSTASSTTTTTTTSSTVTTTTSTSTSTTSTSTLQTITIF